MGSKLIRHTTLGDVIKTETIIKKSRFIGQLFPVTTEDEADEKIAEVRKEYYDATHNCLAMVIGADKNTQRSSDDGEPQGTAGIPMLEVLRQNEITNILAIVTRYYGGVQLGAGGLVRAYGGSVADTLHVAEKIDNIPADIYRFTVDYAGYNKLEQIAADYGASLDSEFTEVVVARLVLDKQLKQRFEKQIQSSFMGETVHTIDGECYLHKAL